MIRSAILLSILAAAFAMPISISRCGNLCYPVSISRSSCPSNCVASACIFRIGRFISIPGTACLVRTQPSSSPIPASPSPSPSSSPSVSPAPTTCTFNLGSLSFSCDCSDGTSADVDVSSKFEGTNRNSRSCFESCLTKNALTNCRDDKDVDAFKQDLDNDFNFCCVSCDAEVDSGVCKPFEP